MIYSVYHFFKHLVDNKLYFSSIEKLESFPFDKSMLACQNVGQFPDLAIKLNTDNPLFAGVELIELKDSKSYNVPSFNSTIPSGKKDIKRIIKSVNSSIKKQMEYAGNNIYLLSHRDAYYLIRGKYKGNLKIILTYGSFFETIKSDDLISQSFEQILEEQLTRRGLKLEKTLNQF
ncbi:MAG: hypothetical protein LBR09_00265 [Endomicrobium sp.]|nr:hypothetical protein [Endomicrobium sp.]